MTIIHDTYTGTLDSQAASSWDAGYSNLGSLFQVGSVCQAQNVSETMSVSALTSPEPDLNPYECMRVSGGLGFWERPEEDVYSFDDGRPA